jgi:DNA-binding response OmpR family regulator
MQALLFSSQGDESALITLLLQRTGFTVRRIQQLEEAIDSWPEQPTDLILIILPENPKASVRRVGQLRAHTAIPIVVIAEALVDDVQAQLLDAGVDLVISRPYSINLLAAQLRSLMRRSGGMPLFSLPNLKVESVHLDPANRTVRVGDDSPRRLTQLEFRLLYTLMIHAGQIIPTETLIEQVWGYAGEGNRELVRGLVQRLRAKVEPEPRNPQFVLTETGIGYYFRND